jgi:transcriptional regulator with XRE-family HTH domain
MEKTGKTPRRQKWDPDLGAQLRALRTRFFKSQEVFASTVRVTPRTVANWESGRNAPQAINCPELRTALKLDDRLVAAEFQKLRRFIVGFDDAAAGTRLLDPSSLSDEDLEKMCDEIDGLLYSLIRDHRVATNSQLRDEHRYVTAGALEKHKLGWVGFLERLQQLRKPIAPFDAFELIFSDTLTTIRLRWGLLAKQWAFPLLVWDCHCHQTDPNGNTAPSNLCPIHRDIDGVRITDRIFSGLPVNIGWRGNKIRWAHKRALWPPSIDSLMLMQDLLKPEWTRRPYRSVLDIGCGTGFLAICFARACSGITEFTFTDWTLAPLKSASDNLALNAPQGRRCSANFILELGMPQVLSQSGHDELVICNPSYLPVIEGFERELAEVAVAGTDLMREIITGANLDGRDVVLAFSHMVLDEAQAAAASLGRRLNPIGPPRRVPFRMRESLVRSGYVNELLKRGGLEWLLDHRFPYWHTIQSFQVSRSS